jgi:hypothetical protein
MPGCTCDPAFFIWTAKTFEALVNGHQPFHLPAMVPKKAETIACLQRNNLLLPILNRI